MGKSGSSSQANQATNTSSHDSRIVNESGIVARDSNVQVTTNTTSVDPEIAKAAFNFASGADARNGEGFDKLLSVAAELTNKTQDSATSMAARYQGDLLQAYDQARTTTPGGIDNKTMMVLGVAGAVAVAAVFAKKGN